MTSERPHSAPAHSHEIMVAQPVSPIQAVQAPPADAMSQGGSHAKEAQDKELSEDFDISDDSPTKEPRDQSLTNHDPRWRTPRSSPSPARSKSGKTIRIRSLPRNIPVKRASSTPTSSILMIPRRGRVAISNAELWGVNERLVHRKVEVTGSEGGAGLQDGMAQQFAEDRVATMQLYTAIQAIAKAVNAHDNDLKDVGRRLDEATKLRFDDNRLHQGAMLHLRTGVEEAKDVVAAQGESIFEEIKKRLDSAVPDLIEAKLVAVKSALDELEATEKTMKEYLQTLHTQRPEEGKMVFSQFHAVREELEALKTTQQQQAAITVNLQSATAAGLNGLASTGVVNGLSESQASMLDIMKSQLETLVATEESRPCHCPDVTSNVARIAYLEVQLASMQAAAGAPSYTVASTFSGAAASSGDGLPPFVKTVAGGNGSCHCRCVEQLLVRVRALEMGRNPTPEVNATAREAFLPHLRQQPPGLDGGIGSTQPMIDINGPLRITLPLGQLANERRDRSIYDEKMMSQAEYRFDGSKNGAGWKSKIERYFIIKVPVALELLKWAEAHNLEAITEAKFIGAAHPNITEEQCQVFNREIWGFLSGCLSGQAEVHFKRVPMLNGLDAWRRVIRVIEDTLPMKFDQLRRAVQMIHVKPIKDLEGIPNGIAEFETTLEEYEAAGGEATSDRIKKSDLLAILPTRIQADLLWNSVNLETPYHGFRDHVLTQASRILDLDRRQRRGGVNAVVPDHEPQMPPLGTSAAEDQREDDEADTNPISSLEELLAMVNRQRTNGGGRPQRQPQRQAPGGARDPAKRPPRKCANCGLEHEARVCPHPAVAREDRKCWTCGRGGHASRDCPDKKRGAAIKAIEDQLPFFGAKPTGGAMAVTERGDGFTPVRMRGTTARPAPRGATLVDFIATPTQNRFGCMTTDDKRPPRPQRRSQPSIAKTMRSQPTESAVLPSSLAEKPNHIINTEEFKVKKTIMAMNGGSVAASDSTLMKDADPKPTRGLKSSPNVGIVSAERASAALSNYVTPLGEGNVSREGKLARTGDAWQRRKPTSEQECVNDLETAVMAAISEYSGEGSFGSRAILRGSSSCSSSIVISSSPWTSSSAAISSASLSIRAAGGGVSSECSCGLIRAGNSTSTGWGLAVENLRGQSLRRIVRRA